MLCLGMGAQRNWVIYLMSQKKLVAKPGTKSSSPGLRLTASPNFSSAFSVLGLSHMSSHIMGQMLYSYSRVTLIYLWLPGHFGLRDGLGEVK